MVGRALAAALEERGHELVLLSRSGRTVPGFGRVIGWDPMKDRPPADAFDQVRAVINLAGEPVSGRWTAAKRERIRQSRLVGTHNLVAGMLEASPSPQLLISASAIGYYGPRGEQQLNEDASYGDGFLADLTRKWEHEAQYFSSSGNRTVIMRLGIVLGRGGALAAALPTARLGLGGPLGGGQQWWSWIHIADVCRFVLGTLDDIACDGVYNVTSPNPVRQRDFSAALGRVLSRPAVLPAPGLFLRAIYGGFASELLDSKRVIPERLMLGGWNFEYTELEPALIDLLDRD